MTRDGPERIAKKILKKLDKQDAGVLLIYQISDDDIGIGFGASARPTVLAALSIWQRGGLFHFLKAF